MDYLIECYMYLFKVKDCASKIPSAAKPVSIDTIHLNLRTKKEGSTKALFLLSLRDLMFNTCSCEKNIEIFFKKKN